MRWLPRLALAGSCIAAGCIGEPAIVECADHPELAGCGSTTQGESSSSDDSDLPPAGVCFRGASPLTVDELGDTVTIANEWFELVLEQDENFMPSRLVATEASDDNLLYDGPDTNQRLMGVQLHDTSFSWSPAAPAQAPIVWEVGPAVVRWSVDWEATHTSDWITSAPNNPTRYTITPDGRMTRLEGVLVAGEPQSGRWLSAYVGLDAEQFELVHIRRREGETYVDATYTPEPAGIMFYPDAIPDDAENLEPTMFCAYDEDEGIAVGLGADPNLSLSDDSTHPPLDNEFAWGMRGNQPGAQSITFLLDWGREFMPSPTVYRTHVMSMVTVADDDPCACMLEQFDVHIDPPVLEIEGGVAEEVIPMTTEWGHDFVTDGYLTDGGYYAIGASENPFVVRVLERARPTTLFRVFGVGDVSEDGFTVRMDGVELDDGVDFLATPSEEPDRGFFLFLARALPPGVALEIGYTPR